MRGKGDNCDREIEWSRWLIECLLGGDKGDERVISLDGVKKVFNLFTKSLTLYLIIFPFNNCVK